jgi:hypothetical protein
LLLLNTGAFVALRGRFASVLAMLRRLLLAALVLVGLIMSKPPARSSVGGEDAPFKM